MSNSTSTTSSCDIEVNPDIVGIGVRVALYVQAIVGPIAAFIAPRGSKRLLALTNKTMGLTGIALLITSFAFAGQHELDLFHAFCLFHLIGLVGLSIVEPENAGDSGDDSGSGGLAGDDSGSGGLVGALSQILYYLGMLGFFVFQIYVFATAPTFGSRPECNAAVKYVLFGIDTPATSPAFRGLFIAMLAIMLLVSLVSLYSDGKDEGKDLVLGTVLEKILRFVCCFSPQTTSLSLTLVLLKRQVARLQDDGKDGYKLLGEVVGRTYVIVMLELMIQRNSTSSTASEWGFGQTLAMVLLLGPIMEVASGYIKPEGGSFTRNDRLRFILQPFIRILVSVVDLSICAAAGAAAAATGAHANGDAVTGAVVRSGALGGVIGSGVLSVCIFVAKAASTSTAVALAFAVLPLGTAFTVALAICNRVLGEAPNAILLGAVLGGIPLIFGSSWNAAGGPNRSMRMIADATKFKSVPLLIAGIVGAFAGLGFDALGGAVFVYVTRDNGHEVCSVHAATAAGVVYSIIVYILRIPQSCAWILMERKTRTGLVGRSSDSD